MSETIFSSARNRKNHLYFPLLSYALLIFSVFVLLSDRISPASFWLVGFVAPLAPLVYMINVVLAIYYLFIRSSRLVLVGIALIVGLPIIQETYQNNDPLPTTDASFRVLSYNVSFFWVPTVFTEQYRSPDYNIRVADAINWLRQNDADIVCLQEFFDDEESMIFSTVEALTGASDYEYHFVYKDQIKNRTRRGLIILTKFPIINRGTVFTSANHYNGAIYADVKTPHGVVRVINTHLESMKLGSQKNIVGILRAYKDGVVTHAYQSNQLAAFTNESPVPVILCGDLNETPYSYAYHQLVNEMRNAFEERGNGFGFTYQGEILSLLRIDHQFSELVFNIHDYITHDQVNFSKHLPIEASYSFKKVN